jgi:hypothetical protein
MLHRSRPAVWLLSNQRHPNLRQPRQPSRILGLDRLDLAAFISRRVECAPIVPFPLNVAASACGAHDMGPIVAF